MSEQHWQTWFEQIWALREETLYRDFFGDTGPGIYPIPASTFAAIGEPSPDPRFLTHGVIFARLLQGECRTGAFAASQAGL